MLQLPKHRITSCFFQCISSQHFLAGDILFLNFWEFFFWDDNAARTSTIIKFVGFMILVFANFFQACCIAKLPNDLTTDLTTDQLLNFRCIVAAPSCGVGVCCCRKMLSV